MKDISILLRIFIFFHHLALNQIFIFEMSQTFAVLIFEI
jgi:hypothetical protein